MLEELLPITLKNTKIDENCKLILVDNASTDDTVEWLEKHYPTIPLLRFTTNYGFTGGYNKATETIDATFHVLLSSDVEVSPNWLPPLVTYLKANKSVGACQPKVLSYYKRDHFEYAGANGGFIDSWGIPFCRGRIFSYSEKDIGQYNSPIDIFWASGCCFAVRTEAWKTTGGLATDFFAHMEEIDLCWRMQRAGYTISNCSDSVVFHMGGQTLSYEDPRKLYLNCRNNLAMLVKNWPVSNLIFRLPLRIVLDWIGAFYFLLTRGVPSFIAIFKGHIDFIKKLPYWYSKRDGLPKSTKNIKGIYKGSIVFHHFIRGVKVFSNLRY